MRVLLAEDDENLGSGIRAGLAQHGFQVDWVRDGMAAEREILTRAHEVVILDMGLPRQGGLTTLQNIRQKKVDTPTLILTAQDELSYRIAGLDGGARGTLCCWSLVRDAGATRAREPLSSESIMWATWFGP